ncbi:MAG: VOC family protein [Terracidiphilus sp.]
MFKNRSVPVDTVLPHLTYTNLAQAIDWLCATFGFVEHYRYGEPVQGAQLHIGSAFIMVNSARAGRSSPAQLDSATQSLTIFIEDVEAHYARARAVARIVEEPHETAYGEFQYGVLDLEGHHWLFARHARDVSPDAWGATITNPLP